MRVRKTVHNVYASAHDYDTTATTTDPRISTPTRLYSLLCLPLDTSDPIHPALGRRAVSRRERPGYHGPCGLEHGYGERAARCHCRMPIHDARARATDAIRTVCDGNEGKRRAKTRAPA